MVVSNKKQKLWAKDFIEGNIIVLPVSELRKLINRHGTDKSLSQIAVLSAMVDKHLDTANKRLKAVHYWMDYGWRQ